MLVRFSIQPVALELSDYDLPHQFEIVQQLGETWLSSYLLIDPASAHGVVERVRTLPGELRKRWAELLVHAAKKKRVLLSPDLSIHDAVDAEALASRTRGKTNLILVQRCDSARFGVPHDKGYVDLENFHLEVCRIDCIRSSQHIQRATQRLNDLLQVDTATDAIWDELLRPFAEIHSTITAVDRYAGANCCMPTEGSGIESLLSRINTLRSGEKTVFLYTSITPEVDQNVIIRSISGVLARMRHGSIREVAVILTPDHVFAKYAHHRYIRFSEDVCFVVDKGLEVLQGKKLRMDIPYYFAATEKKLWKCEGPLRMAKAVQKTFAMPSVSRAVSS